MGRVGAPRAAQNHADLLSGGTRPTLSIYNPRARFYFITVSTHTESVILSLEPALYICGIDNVGSARGVVFWLG